MSSQIDDRSTTSATPVQLGVGMRFSIHPHCDDFVEVILGALQDAADAGLTKHLVLETDEVSTFVGVREDPAEEHLVSYLSAVITAASRRSGGGHVVASVLLSRGCPGEVSCEPSLTGLPVPVPVPVQRAGVPAVAHWSLYPLLDGGQENHMAYIEDAIASARRRHGVEASSVHYATRLSGDLTEVLATAADAWAQIGARVPHVVTHLTVGVGSPTGDAAGVSGADDAGSRR